MLVATFEVNSTVAYTRSPMWLILTSRMDPHCSKVLAAVVNHTHSSMLTSRNIVRRDLSEASCKRPPTNTVLFSRSLRIGQSNMSLRHSAAELTV